MATLASPRIAVVTWVVLCCLCLASCINQKAMMQALVPHDDDVLARKFIEWVRVGNYDEAKLNLDASLPSDEIDTGLRAVHGLLAKGDVLEIDLIGCNISTNSTKRRSNLSYQIHFHDSWVAGDVVLDTQNGSTTVVGFHFNPIPDSFESLNRFSLQDKSLFHYVILAICIINPLFILYALVICIRTRIRRKWLWIIFILFGLMQIDFNWTTGETDMKPISILLFASGYHAVGPYAPLIFEFGFPVGAVVFLVRRKASSSSAS